MSPRCRKRNHLKASSSGLLLYGKKGLFFPHGSLYKVGERKPLPIKIMLPPVYIQLSINEIQKLKLRKKKTDKV